MASLRDQLNARPWLGWILAGLAMIAVVVMYLRMSRGDEGALSADALAEEVTIRYTDTGKTVTMLRGRLTRELLDRDGKLDPEQGILNPETGKYSGVLVNDREWNRLVQEINALKSDAEKNRSVPNR